MIEVCYTVVNLQCSMPQVHRVELRQEKTSNPQICQKLYTFKYMFTTYEHIYLVVSKVELWVSGLFQTLILLHIFLTVYPQALELVWACFFCMHTFSLYFHNCRQTLFSSSLFSDFIFFLTIFRGGFCCHPCHRSTTSYFMLCACLYHYINNITALRNWNISIFMYTVVMLGQENSLNSQLSFFLKKSLAEICHS